MADQGKTGEYTAKKGEKVYLEYKLVCLRKAAANLQQCGVYAKLRHTKAWWQFDTDWHNDVEGMLYHTFNDRDGQQKTDPVKIPQRNIGHPLGYRFDYKDGLEAPVNLNVKLRWYIQGIEIEFDREILVTHNSVGLNSY